MSGTEELGLGEERGLARTEDSKAQVEKKKVLRRAMVRAGERKERGGGLRIDGTDSLTPDSWVPS